ncbi:MAG: acetylornithine/succinylornithine family transaminase [Coriobacteriia bacterium]|nr:acetylornithine/succinylornithine family transaminase [Coriobacteriia bacterium]
MSLEQQQQLEETYVIHNYARKPLDLTSGKGMVAYDDKGAEYLDFIGGIGACSLGHCHPAVVDAIKQQAETLIHVSNYYYIEGRGQAAQKVSDLLNTCVPEDQRTPWQSFFANSGAEANECAIKLARLYARRKHVAAGGSPETAPRTVVVLNKSFHGRTLATLAATAQKVKQELFQPLPDGFVHTEINDVEALQALFDQQGKNICAVMLEVVQGESGVHPCSQEFLQAVRSLTQEYGATMICDEVQCGIYRCGTYPFAFQHFGVTPDIVSIAKGIASGFPCGMCAARAEVAAAFEPGDHGSTFGGSNLAIAAINATLDTLQAEGIPQNVTEVGAYLREQLATLPQFTNVRGLGLMVAVDLAEGVEMSAPDIVAEGLNQGLVLNYTGPATLRFLPPLVCTTAHVDALVEKFANFVK